MLSPILEFNISDFYSSDELRIINSFNVENIVNEVLIDNLYLLHFLDFNSIADIIYKKYKVDLVYLNSVVTHPELKAISDKFGIFIEKRKEVIAYIPLGTVINKADLEIEIPNYRFVYKYIMLCNYNALIKKLDLSILSNKILDFRPLLVFRRLILDCIEHTGTDIHFVSFYRNKKPEHHIQYRIKRELKESTFKLDYALILKIINKLISNKSSASAVDLDSIDGITTDVSDLFSDETIDLRVTGTRTSAGLYVVIAIQQVTTTSKKLNELGIFSQDVDKLKYLSNKDTGLTLYTGEMRSGKNTSIFASLNERLNDPIRIIEYSNPIEVKMPFPQINYKGNINALKSLMRLSKKQDINIAVLNEIPNQEVAFSVRDLINSAIGVITTTHLNRVWHIPYKLEELYGKDYKSIISQLNAVINHKMFRKQSNCCLVKKVLNPSNDFEKYAASIGVTQYYEPIGCEKCKIKLQPIVEILIMNDFIKTELLNHKSLYESEQYLRNYMNSIRETIEYKIACGINMGIFNLEELRLLY